MVVKSRWEYELMNKLSEIGVVVRAAGSGLSAICDLVFFNKSISKCPFFIECKETKNDIYYINYDQINKLIEVTRKYGGIPILAIKFKRRGYLFVNLLKNNNKNKYTADEINIRDLNELKKFLKNEGRK